MGQIVSSAAKPKRCNANQLSQVPTPAAGEYILVSSDNSMNAAGQGNFDCYIVGVGNVAATELPLHKFKAEELDAQINGLPADDDAFDVPTTAGSGIGLNSRVNNVSLKKGRTYLCEVTGGETNTITMYFFNSSGVASYPYIQEAGGAAKRISITPTQNRSMIITPQDEDVAIIKFYGGASGIKETGTMSFSFHSEKTKGIADDVTEVVASDATKVSKKYGKNIFDKSAVVTGYYLNVNGYPSSSQSAYSISDYMPVDSDKDYFIGKNETQGTGSANACHVWYDESKEIIRVDNGGYTTFSPPEGAHFLRISISGQTDESFSTIQVKEGSSYGIYEPYSPIGGYPTIIEEDSISYEMLDDNVKEIIQNNQGASFSAFKSSETLAAGSTMNLPQLHVEKNIFESVEIKGSFTGFRFGVGYNGSAKGYGSQWIEIDATNVKHYSYDGGNDVLVNSYEHGLTLSSNMVAEVDKKLNGNTFVVTFTLYDNLGNSFEQQLAGWGYGIPFAENVSSNGSVNVTLTFMPRDITKKVWCFGDSYFGFTYANKWNYYFAQKDMTKWLSNNQPGLSPASAYTDLVNLLSVGAKPKYLLWCLGMNGDTTETQVDGQYVINDSQKAVVDSVKTLCEQNGITLVLSTVPTVPTRQKTGFCNYVRNLGVRYVDVAAAVGTNEQGVWNTGLLSSDGVHPTSAGAKVIASQVMVDFPEITINE